MCVCICNIIKVEFIKTVSHAGKMRYDNHELGIEDVLASTV